MSIVHIIGAGVAGLAAAVRLVHRGKTVHVYESAGQAGGRCRSFVDKSLGQMIDNGNHLLFSGNRSALAYLEEIGARDTLMGPDEAAFPFFDLNTGERWTLRPSKGAIPWWVLDAERRVPGTSISDYLSGIRVAMARPSDTVGHVLPQSGLLYKRFWEPLTLAALNSQPDKGAAQLLWAVLAETFMKGEAACRPLIARKGLGPSLVNPALSFLESKNQAVQLNCRLRALTLEDRRVAALDFGERRVPVQADDTVIVALPPSRASQIVPGLDAPDEGEVIVNAHFRLSEPVAPPQGIPFMGLINSTAHWVFVRENIVSLTISAASNIADQSSDDLVPLLWRETSAALELNGQSYEAARIIKEKRATFDQSPANVAKRHTASTAFQNLVLAGDWTDTGLPATIESAARSGQTAASLILKRTVGR